MFALFPEFDKWYEIIPIPMIHENDKGEIGDDILAMSDVYIHQDIRRENKFGFKLSDEYTLSKLSDKCISIVIPNLVGFGGWLYPNLGRLITNEDKTENYCFEDSVLEEAYKRLGSNSLIDDYIEYYYAYKFDESIIKNKFDEDWSKIKSREENWDIKIADYIEQKFKCIPMFVDAGHPSKYLMRKIGFDVLDMLEINYSEENLEYESYLGIPTPILPSVKLYYGISFDLPYEQRKSRFFGNYSRFDESRYISEYVYEYIKLAHSVDLQFEE